MPLNSFLVCVSVSVCVCVCLCVSNGPDESVRMRAGGDVTADRLPAGMLRAPIESVPSLQLPPTTRFPFSFHSPRLPHICCVLGTDSKLQHPGPLSDSIPISSHVHLLSSFGTIIQLTFSASV